MAKATLIIAVFAFCAFVADGQFAFFTPFFTHPPPNSRPVAHAKNALGHLKFCQGRTCFEFDVHDYGCNNVPGQNENDRASTIDDTSQRCFYLFEHINCQGRRVRVGPNCYQDDCCPKNLEDCNFRNKMSSYMLC